jgi:GNAT superfamily N-acetyltransferase
MQNVAPYELSTDLSRINWQRIHAWLASSYWSPGISFERVKRGSENSAMVIGIYCGREQVAFARIISDKSRFAYVCDVWVDEQHRGKGLARRMVQHALDHPDFQTVNWLLATVDAHGVYAKLGFAPLKNSERWMSKGAFCTGVSQ